ncbi:ribokinase [Neltuma alba]|uniref:ribokinase n=2 Tax=Neltuma alba TaxID=207710 RepID=UPI0010A41FCE|nr:ribokinase-like [Prosopis alba]
MLKPLYLAPSNAVTTTFRCRNLRVKMSSDATPPPESRVVVGFGMTTVDFLATVDAYPKPDDKVRTTSFKIQGGGNAGNALTCAARLGLKPKLISKVSGDAQGRGILKELEADGVDTSFFVVSKDGSSTFSYVLVDNQTKTRTCIYTPGEPPLMPTDLSQSILLSAFNEARLVYFDGTSTETALFVAHEAARNNIPILVGAESVRGGLDELLGLADYAVCSARFPQAWTQAPSIPSALVSMLLRLPNIKFVIVTLGEDGCIMLERSITEGTDIEERDVDNVIESLYKERDDDLIIPTCISSTVTKLKADGIGTVCGRLFVGTAEKIPACELTDTTGAGDAFSGAVLYAICANMLPEKMLPFASQVAAANCRALGARSGLPHRTDPRLASFLG